VPLARLLGVSVEWILTGTEADPGTFLATVFATSLTGYAKRASRVTPGELAAWANAIHYAVTEAVLGQGGVPIKCVGDGFLGFFSGSDQAERALCAARQAKSACNQPELVIVLHAGPIYLGSVGHPDYARTDIIGATVNTAFLLIPFVAAHCASRVGLTGSVREKLPVETAMGAQGEIAVLGMDSPLSVFEPSAEGNDAGSGLG
jgi:class 3 adenylate cyclase